MNHAVNSHAADAAPVNHKTSSTPLDKIVVPVEGVINVREELTQLADLSYLMAVLTSDTYQKESSPYSILSPYFMREHGCLNKSAAELSCAIDRSKMLG